jgi:hypothetical protein
MSLEAQLRHLFSQYIEATSMLSQYVEDSEEGFRKLSDENEIVSDKIHRARKSGKSGKFIIQEIKSFENEKTVKTSFSEDEFDILISAMEHRIGLLQSYPGLLYRMAFIYLVALFDAFLADVFQLVLVARPQALRSKKQLTYEKILEFSSHEDLVRYLVQRELHELAYQSIRDQFSYYESRFNVSLAKSGVPIEVLTEIRAARNVLVHNNGIVNHIYLELVHEAKYNLNDQLVISLEYWKQAEESLKTVAAHVHGSLRDKFASPCESE